MSEAKTLGCELAGSTSYYPLTPPEVAAAEPLRRVGTASSRRVRDAYEGQTPSSSNEHPGVATAAGNAPGARQGRACLENRRDGGAWRAQER